MKTATTPEQFIGNILRREGYQPKAPAIVLYSLECAERDAAIRQDERQKLQKNAVECCPRPCVCGSTEWPCHVDGDDAAEFVLRLAKVSTNDLS